jgi:hypothetical protein
MGKKKKEKQRKRVSVDWAYNGFYRRKESVGDSVGESATSLYGYLSLNPSVMSVGKIVWRHHAVAYFQTNCIPRRRNRQYIPTVLPTGCFRRYIPIDLETELFPSVIGDRIISVGIYYRRKNSVGNSVGFLRFSGSVSYTFYINLLIRIVGSPCQIPS